MFNRGFLAAAHEETPAFRASIEHYPTAREVTEVMPMFTNENIPNSVVRAEKLALYVLRANSITSTDAHATIARALLWALAELRGDELRLSAN